MIRLITNDGYWEIKGSYRDFGTPNQFKAVQRNKYFQDVIGSLQKQVSIRAYKPFLDHIAHRTISWGKYAEHIPYKEMIDQLGVSKSTVARAINYLVEVGAIIIIKRERFTYYGIYPAVYDFLIRQSLLEEYDEME